MPRLSRRQKNQNKVSGKGHNLFILEKIWGPEKYEIKYVDSTDVVVKTFGTPRKSAKGRAAIGWFGLCEIDSKTGGCDIWFVYKPDEFKVFLRGNLEYSFAHKILSGPSFSQSNLGFDSNHVEFIGGESDDEDDEDLPVKTDSKGKHKSGSKKKTIMGIKKKMSKKVKKEKAPTVGQGFLVQPDCDFSDSDEEECEQVPEPINFDEV